LATKRVNYTQKTLGHLRDLGYTVDVAEKWVPAPHMKQQGGGFRRDLFNFVDIVALHRQYRGVIGVQSTSYGQVAPHAKKIREIEEAGVWVDTGNLLLLIGWEKVFPPKKDGSPGKAARWIPRTFRFDAETWRHGTVRPPEIQFGRNLIGVY